MAQPYLENLTALLERAAPDFIYGDVVECRHFFSGAAAYAKAQPKKYCSYCVS